MFIEKISEKQVDFIMTKLFGDEWIKMKELAEKKDNVGLMKMFNIESNSNYAIDKENVGMDYFIIQPKIISYKNGVLSEKPNGPKHYFVGYAYCDGNGGYRAVNFTDYDICLDQHFMDIFTKSNNLNQLWKKNRDDLRNKFQNVMGEVFGSEYTESINDNEEYKLFV